MMASAIFFMNALFFISQEFQVKCRKCVKFPGDLSSWNEYRVHDRAVFSDRFRDVSWDGSSMRR